jgi:5'/3'-nucleotidase SurE
MKYYTTSKKQFHSLSMAVICLSFFLIFSSSLFSAQPLNILLTNDDGYTSPGIMAMKEALVAAGHNVTIVAPLENQSGKGASVVSAQWINIIRQAPGVWSVENTPAVAANAGISLILKDNPPDLIISGLNFGQNIGRSTSVASGTVCAALQGVFAGIPAIAASVGIDFDEYYDEPIPFPSTFAAFEPASQFIVETIAELQRTSRDGRILPEDLMLNIVFPIPYDQIEGVKFTKLGKLSAGALTFIDYNNVIPDGGGPVMMGREFFSGPDPVAGADTDAYWDGYISISVLSGDLTASVDRFVQVATRLIKLVN